MSAPNLKGVVQPEPLIFEISREGRIGYSLPDPGLYKTAPLPPELSRKEKADWPELSEVDVVRHFTRLSTWNHSVDAGLYPLGSCTMKYNPKINESAARLSGFATLHPSVGDEYSQGSLGLMYELASYLAEISGLDEVSLQPSAGAQGELCGMLIISAFHKDQGRRRTKVLVPDTAHGTNPASCAIAGFQAVQIKSGPDGILEPDEVKRRLDDQVAAIMITNPNTLGLFEKRIAQIAEAVHEAGGLVYCDGANLNALLGVARPGDLGVDVMHFNLHKTFSGPHGGGGPGSGPIGVKSHLAPFLPIPIIVKDGKIYRQDSDRPKSIGRVRGHYGNFGVMVRAYTYIRELGAESLRDVARMSVLNANYIRVRLAGTYNLPYPGICMHECVFDESTLARFEIKTMDLAKRLIDYGIHPPTVYFPLVVKGAIMIEPTETESKDHLDYFIAAMEEIANEAKTNPDLLHAAPVSTKVGRLDEVKAARDLKVRA